MVLCVRRYLLFSLLYFYSDVQYKFCMYGELTLIFFNSLYLLLVHCSVKELQVISEHYELWC